MALVAEIEADNRMCDPGRAPPGDKDIDAVEISKVVGTCLPVAGVVLLAAVVAVAEVVDCDLVSVDVGVSGFSVVGLLVAVVWRLEREPPYGDDNESGESNRQPHATGAEELHGCQDHNEVQHGGGCPQRRKRRVEAEHCGRPDGE
jgi:hypothetical protein